MITGMYSNLRWLGKSVIYCCSHHLHWPTGLTGRAGCMCLSVGGIQGCVLLTLQSLKYRNPLFWPTDNIKQQKCQVYTQEKQKIFTFKKLELLVLTGKLPARLTHQFQLCLIKYCQLFLFISASHTGHTYNHQMAASSSGYQSRTGSNQTKPGWQQRGDASVIQDYRSSPGGTIQKSPHRPKWDQGTPWI